MTKKSKAAAATATVAVEDERWTSRFTARYNFTKADGTNGHNFSVFDISLWVKRDEAGNAIHGSVEIKKVPGGPDLPTPVWNRLFQLSEQECSCHELLIAAEVAREVYRRNWKPKGKSAIVPHEVKAEEVISKADGKSHGDRMYFFTVADKAKGEERYGNFLYVTSSGMVRSFKGAIHTLLPLAMKAAEEYYGTANFQLNSVVVDDGDTSPATLAKDGKRQQRKDAHATVREIVGERKFEGFDI